MTISSLKEIRGVGSALAKKLIEHFGSEEQAIQIIVEGDVAKLSSIEGLGERFAARLVRTVYAQKLGVNIDDFLQTQDSLGVYDEILDIIRDFSKTQFSRSKLLLYFPVPISKISLLKERQKFFEESKNLVDLLAPKLPEIDPLLSRLTPLKLMEEKVDVGSRAVITTEQKTYEKLMNSRVAKFYDILLIEDIEELQSYFMEENESLVLLFSDRDLYMEDTENVFEFSPSRPIKLSEVVPEEVILFFGRNRECVLAVSQLAEIFSEYTANSPFLTQQLGDLTLASLTEIKSDLELIKTDGELDVDVDPEFKRLTQAVSSMDKIIAEIETGLNESLADEIQDTTVKLEGEKLLRIVKAETTEYGEVFSEYLDESLYGTIEKAIEEAEKKIGEKLDLKDDELVYIEDFFPKEIIFPLEAIQDKTEQLERYLRKKLAYRTFELKSNMARKLEEMRTLFSKAANTFLELEFSFMLGKFARAYNLILPRLNPKAKGISFKDAYNICLLKENRSKGLKVEPVTYVVGTVEEKPPNIGTERVVLLSGANSGGKTTLLMTIAYCVILGQMGFGVPAQKAEIGLFDELFYFKKATGAVNAGAFEATLKNLTRMILSENARIILADEMESISEPGASARVIGSFLDLLSADKAACGVFVTHLAQEIGKESKFARIDGIEARGLDENLELIVDRSPKFYKYARSTPQLIVERLSKKMKGKEKEVYEEILKRFTGS
ncbi:MAG: helix-hairpin-helix domain-containing protein [Candidatus Hermodarchaeota archaeon]